MSNMTIGPHDFQMPLFLEDGTENPMAREWSNARHMATFTSQPMDEWKRKYRPELIDAEPSDN